MAKGKIKEYHSDQGYGSILDFETGQTLILYANDINLKKDEVLMVGQEVEYDIEQKRSENWAINVRFLNAENV